MMLRATGLHPAIAIAALAAACGPPPDSAAPARPAPAPPRMAAGELPSLARWRQHVTDEILPFWDTPAALGTPVGNFPTYRCNDGTLPRPEALCPELAQPPRWMAGDLDKDFARMKSRQTFLYGVAFHITGEERYLEYARAGVAWLLARVVKDRFFAPEHGMFWGALQDPRSRQLGSWHTDFGHSMKSMWMLYLTGQLTGERELVDFARPLIAPLLARAAQPSGCWASGLDADGSLDRGSQWWIFAELDQAAATLAGREPSPAPYAGYLARSYECWFTRLVDHEHHDVWPGIPPAFPPASFAHRGPLKQHLWKNGYHDMEHALVALITTAGLTGQRLALYYAFAVPPPRARIQPYYFTGAIAAERDHPLPHHPGLHGRRVEFEALH